MWWSWSWISLPLFGADGDMGLCGGDEASQRARVGYKIGGDPKMGNKSIDKEIGIS